MAINLEKNKESLLAAWKEIVDDKIRTDWALFGYEGHTFDLKLVSKGDGGLEEMAEDINSSKIMYAFCRVLDPKTSLPKFVLINWQGEAAPMERKGKCANHIRDVAHFFKGAHVTINARTEDDIDPDVVIDKVSKSTVSAYNFKERSGPLQDSLPVSSVYKRTIPTAEINPIERDKFWEKEEAEERKRLEEEKRKAEDTKKKLEEERRRRELEEAKAREERFKEKAKFVSLQDVKNTQNISKNVISEREKWERQMKEDRREEEERKRRSESMRKERKEEAQALIAQRTINARAIFEKNTAAGQMSSIARSSVKVAAENQIQDQHSASVTMQSSQPEVVSSQQLAKSLPRPDVIPQTPPGASPPSPSPEPQPVADHQDFSYTRNLLKEGLPPRMDSDQEEEEEQDWDNTNQTVALEATTAVTDPLEALTQEQNFSDAFNQEHTYEEYNQAFPDAQFYTGQGLCARALYDYQAADETEISFDPDDIITHIEQIDEGWWQGMSPGGTYGLFPANYVELIK